MKHSSIIMACTGWQNLCGRPAGGRFDSKVLGEAKQTWKNCLNAGLWWQKLSISFLDPREEG